MPPTSPLLGKNRPDDANIQEQLVGRVIQHISIPSDRLPTIPVQGAAGILELSRFASSTTAFSLAE
jgi:hypothetical protein